MKNLSLIGNGQRGSGRMACSLAQFLQQKSSANDLLMQCDSSVDVSPTLGAGCIEHTFSIHSAYIEHILQSRGSQVAGRCLSRAWKYVACLVLMVFLGVGEMWGTNYTFKAGTTIYYDFTAISGGANWHNGSNLDNYDASAGGTIKAVTFASDVTMNETWWIAKTATGSWAGVTLSSFPTTGQNVVKISSDGKSMTWGTATFAIAGEMNEWSTTTNSSSTGSLEIELDAHTTYEFKVIYKGAGGDKWCGISDTRISSSIADYNCTWGGGDNIHIMTAGAGKYTFAYDFTNNQLDVTYPSVTHPTIDYCYLQNYSWSSTYLELHESSDTHATKGWPGQQLHSPATTTIGGVVVYYFAMGSNYTSIQCDDNSGNYTGYQTPTYGQYLNYTSGWGWRTWSFTVTLNNGGATTYPSNPSVQFNGAAPSALTPPTKNGYTFGGYYNTSACDDKQVIAADGKWNKSVAGFTDGSGKWIHEGGTATLYAKWTANTYTITLNNNGATTAGTTSVTATFETNSNISAQITRPEKTGYTFNGYYDDEEFTNTWIISDEGYFTWTNDYIDASGKWKYYTGDVDLYADWNEITHTVTVANDGNGTTNVSSVSGVGIATASSTITATPTFGYRFSSWTIPTGVTIASGSTTNPSITINATADSKTITANFVREYIYVEGAMTIYNATRGSETSVTWSDETSTAIQMEYDGTNHRYYLHTYNTVSNLKGAGNENYFYFKASTSSSSLANVVNIGAYSNNASYKDLTAAGSGKQGGRSKSNTYQLNPTTPEDGYAILYLYESEGNIYLKYELEHAFSYYGNEGSGDAPAARTYYNHGATPTAASNSYTRSGYTFSKWNTAADGSGTNYTPGASVTLNAAEVCLSAQWTGRTYNIKYRECDNSTEITGLAPTTYTCGVGVAELPTPTKSGYTFDAWYSKYCVYDDTSAPGGHGFGWVNGCTKTSISTTTYGDYVFLAKWHQTVTLDMQGVCSDLTPTVEYLGTALTGYSTGSVTLRDGTLLGYYTAASGGTKVLNADGSFADTNVTDYITGGKWTKAGATTLYAHWDAAIALPDTLRKSNYVAYGGGLTFDSNHFNYGTGSGSHLDGYAEWNVDIAQKCVYTITLNGTYSNGHQWELYLVDGSGSTVATCTIDKTYSTGSYNETKNWDLSGLSETGVYVVKAKNILKDGSPKLLYVAMDPISVTYDANGGTCATASAYYAGSALTLPTATKDGYVFEGWFSDGTKIGNAGGSYSPTASITLTAKWGQIIDLPNTLTKTNVGDYSSDMTWYGDDDEYFDFGPTDAANLGRWAKWEVNVVPCEYTISVDVDFGGSSAIKWGLILLNGTDTVATYNSIRKDGYRDITYAAKWDLTKDREGEDLAAGTYTLELKNIQSYAQPKIKSLTLTPDLFTVSYAAGTYGSGSLAGGTKTGCINYTLSSSDDAFTRAGYAYDGWSTNADGSTKDYNLGATYSTDAAITLYPHWTCATPPDPTGFSAGTITDGSVTFTIADDADAASYEIYYSTSSTAPVAGTAATTTSDSKTKAVTGLTAGTTYYAWVRAVCDGSHKSAWVALDESTFATDYSITMGAVTTRKPGDPATGGTIASDVSHALAGATVTLTATPNSGYTFISWKIEKTSDNSNLTNTLLGADSVNVSTSFAMPAYGVTVKATFAKVYSITYKETDKTTTIDGLAPTSYIYGVGVAELPTPTKTGYTFDSWYSSWCVDHEHGGEFDNDCRKTSISSVDYGSATYYATWTTNTLTFNAAEDADWNNTDNWSEAILPTIEHDVVITKPAEVNITDAWAKSVVIDQSGDNDGQLILTAGKELVVATTVRKTTDGSSYGPTGEYDIIFDSDASNGLGALVMGEHDGTNQATVNFYTLSHGSKGSSASVSQYVGTPFGNRPKMLNQFYYSWMYKFDYPDESGNVYWNRIDGDTELEAFRGYCIVSADPAGHKYWMQGALVATDDKTFNDLRCNVTGVSGNTEYNNEHMFANSWMAPIKINAFSASDFGDHTTATIYIFNSGSPEDYDDGGTSAGQYVAYPVNTAAETDVIPAMQAFSVYTYGSTGDAASLTLDYSRLVYDPAVATGDDHAAITPNKAPARNQTKLAMSEKMHIYVSAESGYRDQVYMLAHEDFTDGFENGWDGSKIFGESAAPQLYAQAVDGKMAVNCVPTMEGTVLGFRKGTEDMFYTFSFDYNEQNTWYLNDLKEYISTPISPESSYTFMASDDDAARFIISQTPIRYVPTAVENGEAAAGATVRKLIINEHVYIIRGGRMYDATGVMVR